jgi:low temperature requirement protein LtrA
MAAIDPPRPPRLPRRQRPPDSGEEVREGWLELFFDLVFVAATLLLSSAFAHGHHLADHLWFVGVFVGIWWVWLATTLHANRFPSDDLVHRLLSLTQMFLVTMVAIGAADGDEVHTEFMSITYGLLLLTVAVTYARSARGGRAVRFARARALEYSAAGLIFLISTPLPVVPRVALWLIGLAVAIVPAVLAANGAPPVDERHLLERMGAFTIIVCGEAFVKVALAADEGRLESINVLIVVLEFLLVFALWWSYFDDVPSAGLPDGSNRRSLWIGGHLVLHLCIVGVAIGVAKFITLDPSQDVPFTNVAYVAHPLAASYLALAAIGACTRRRPRAPLVTARLVTASVIGALAVFAWWAPWFDSYWFVSSFALAALIEAAVAARFLRRSHVLPMTPEEPFPVS